MVAIVAMLTAFSLPAARSLFDSMVVQGSGKAAISSALANARAIAAREHRYAGIRFQQEYSPDGPLNASQYMIFIVHEEPKKMGNLANGFRVVEGTEPIKLPDDIGVMDSGLIEEILISNPTWEPSGDPEIRHLTTFSIVFSPSGKMLIHLVRVRNRDGDYQPLTLLDSADDIFNSPENIEFNNTGMFIQDDYPGLGLDQELSRNSFVIYDREEFRQAYQRGQGYSGYLQKLVLNNGIIYMNPYTGTMISTD